MDWALFFSALLSSTLLPSSSEALLMYQLSEHANPYRLVMIVSTGNILGSLITYAIGRIGNQLTIRWLHIDNKKVLRAEQWFTRYGQPSLLFAWLPIIGDPLCLIAGALRTNVLIFIILVSLGKAARYSVIASFF